MYIILDIKPYNVQNNIHYGVAGRNLTYVNPGCNRKPTHSATATWYQTLDLNQEPSAYQTDALTIELVQHWWVVQDLHLVIRRMDLQSTALLLTLLPTRIFYYTLFFSLCQILQYSIYSTIDIMLVRIYVNANIRSVYINSK